MDPEIVKQQMDEMGEMEERAKASAKISEEEAARQRKETRDLFIALAREEIDDDNIRKMSERLDALAEKHANANKGKS